MGKHRIAAASLHAGYDAGNYDNAYLLGFYSSYENHEIPESRRDEVIFAEHEYGPRMRAAGIGVDPR